MANLTTNPWSFTTADVASSATISSVVVNGYSALVTTSAAHGFSINQQISLQGITGANHVPNNGYAIQSVPSTTTFLVSLGIPNYANSGTAGTAYSVAYPWKLRCEQIQWSDPSSNQTLTLTDTNGNLVWTYTSATVTSGSSPSVTYGKVYWVDGLVIQALPSGTVLMTIN
jgi:hypothetical protein